jgi:beta-lactamase superfamily II metal-dependent hydrolase
VFPDGTTMMIDAGMEGHAPILALNLQRMGIEKLDYFVLTHAHDDHGYGAVKSDGILHKFEVGQVYYNGVLNGDWANPTILTEVCRSRKFPCDVLKAGDTLEIGDVKIEVLHPDGSLAGTTITDNITGVNNSSLVMRFDYGEHSSLFTGDIYKTAERELVKNYKEKLDVDLLKMPHHGGDTSNDSSFVRAVTPEISVATGFDAVDIAAYNNYKPLKTTVMMDTEDGYIHVSSGSDGVLSYETSRERSAKSMFGQLNKG